ncbi:helix-turn-helix domain-containing protein [Tessaracoccus flavescens]|uniref:Transposase IS204/IS1001/IS1096/IS1165 helix-turn-helix domain-containing protein n=1 Tax=Tessaracoccus flavescens TaxID=399497 RepID=A0A1Q2CYE6_9ACTN|nr:helix-turn-helix domain-containing protein [Tessaracoccus flavescens]AQP51113.1 hypothetical protein BW733_10015 [Tessaracoccus flavescens]
MDGGTRGGRQRVELIDAPCFTAPVKLWWRKRRWVCPEPMCPVNSFMEQDPDVARPRALLTSRATSWAIGQIRRENASVQGMARQLGCAWRTLWRAVKPILEAAAADEARFAGVTSLGVDEHIVRHEALLYRMEVGGPLKVWLTSGFMPPV